MMKTFRLHFFQQGSTVDDTRTYIIQLRGQVAEADLKAISLVELTAVQITEAATAITVFTDQSGLVGLLRCLHSRGLVL